MGRTVIVGDVHGCRVELETLLVKTHWAEGVDRLFFVGDLVARGPDSRGVLALVEKLGGRAVRGNHEDKLLRARDEGSPGAPGRGRNLAVPTRLEGEHERLAAQLSQEDWYFLEQMPLWIDLAEHGVRLVHAGVVPGKPIERTPREALLTIRAVDASGRWSDAKERRPLWGEQYVGTPHVVFGHNALLEPQLHSWATGIDTGCVYGGRLTALVLDERQPMPRGIDAARMLASVPAQRSYYGGGVGRLYRRQSNAG
jgi:hypothetical protein